MKIIKLSDFVTDSDCSIDLIPDSALQKSGKPFFVPVFAEHFSGSVYMAVHICRLGKNIAAKFAHRYYDECGLCFAITADNLLEKLQSEGRPWAMATAFDGSIIIGEPSPAEVLSGVDVVLSDCGKELWRESLTGMNARFDNMIEYVSRFFTLKIGDIILIAINKSKSEINIGSHFMAAINGKSSLDIRIK